jgi:hypothetical protein
MAAEPTPAELDALGRIYRGAVKDLRGLLKGADFQRGKASRLLAQVDEISKRTGEASDRWVSASTRRIYKAAAGQVDLKLAKAGAGLPLGPVGADWMRINERAVNQFSRQIAQDLARAQQGLADTGRRIISKTSQLVVANPALSETIAKGLVSGGNLRNIGRSLQARLAEGGKELLDSGAMTAAQLKRICDFDAGVIQAGRMRLPLPYYCEMVAGYQLREASTAATLERLGDIGRELGDPDTFDLVIIVGPEGGCDVCDEYVGEIYSISGRSKDYEPLPGGGPPWHPNCTHNVAPYIEALA